MSPPFPFRLYGFGMHLDGEPDYRIQFAPEVDMEAAVEALEAFAAFEGAPPEFELFVEVEGRFVHFAFNEPPEESCGYESVFLDHFQAVHAEFPIVEVVNLRPGLELLGGPWQTWSLEQQPRPDEGPHFCDHWVWG